MKNPFKLNRRFSSKLNLSLPIAGRDGNGSAHAGKGFPHQLQACLKNKLS